MATKKSKLRKTPTKGTGPQVRTAPQVGTAPTDIKAQADPSALSIGDLKNLSTILDVASSRGAFRANEMASIGLVYNKLQAFLARVAPPEAEKKEGTMAPTTTPTQQALTPITPITPKSVGKI